MQPPSGLSLRQQQAIISFSERLARLSESRQQELAVAAEEEGRVVLVEGEQAPEGALLAVQVAPARSQRLLQQVHQKATGWASKPGQHRAAVGRVHPSLGDDHVVTDDETGTGGAQFMVEFLVKCLDHKNFDVRGAAALALLAFVTTPRPPAPDAFADRGEAFFPDFEDPNAAATLEVVEFDEE